MMTASHLDINLHLVNHSLKCVFRRVFSRAAAMHLKSVAVSLKDEAQHIIWTTTLPLPDRPPRFLPPKDMSSKSQPTNTSRATTQRRRTTRTISFSHHLAPPPAQLPQELSPHALSRHELNHQSFTPTLHSPAQLHQPQDPKFHTNHNHRTTDQSSNTTQHQSSFLSDVPLPWSAPTFSTVPPRASSPSPQSVSRPNRNFSACL